MKKSILIGALCALMLFAFTACEPAVPEIPHDVTVIGARITDGDLDYYAGDDFDSSRYTVEILFSDGTPREINGLGILSATVPSTATTADVTINYAGYEGKKIGTIRAYTADSISLNTADVKKEYANTITTESAVDTTGLVVTATYAGNKTKEVTGYTAKFTTVGKDSATVTVSLGDKTATYDVKLVEPEESDEPYTITMAQVTEISATWIGSTLYTTDAATEVADTANWKVVGTDGKLGSISISQFDIKTATSMSASGEYTVEISKSYGGKYFRTQVVVEVENTLNASAMTFNGGSKIFTINVPTLNQDYTLDADDFAEMAKLIYAEYTDGSSTLDGTTNNGTYTIVADSVSQVFFPRTLPASSDTAPTISFDFTWSGNGNAVEYSMTDVKVVFVPAAE